MLALALIFSLIPPTEHRAELELRTLVCAFLAIVGSVSLYGGYWLFAHGGDRAPRNNSAVAAFFTGFGVLLIGLVVMATMGPWHLHQPTVLPVRVEREAPAYGP
jgi:hypothetical protein